MTLCPVFGRIRATGTIPTRGGAETSNLCMEQGQIGGDLTYLSKGEAARFAIFPGRPQEFKDKSLKLVE